MSGNYQTVNQDAPGGLAETAAAVQAGVQAAQRVSDARQADAARFIRENGYEVVSGHADVGTPQS
jgi:hypothetical protein